MLYSLELRDHQNEHYGYWCRYGFSNTQEAASSFELVDLVERWTASDYSDYTLVIKPIL